MSVENKSTNLKEIFKANAAVAIVLFCGAFFGVILTLLFMVGYLTQMSVAATEVLTHVSDMYVDYVTLARECNVTIK